jgi:hypothetical protein
VSLAACGSLSQTTSAPEPEDPAEANLQDLLVGEIALQRGEVDLAAQTYVDVAKRTRDPRVARRAIEISSAARMPELSVEAARIWYDVEPSPQSLQALAAFLVGAKRVEEAEPYLEKLLQTEGVNVENFFAQVNRLLAGNPDKASNLRVVRKLAAQYPQLPQAHLAVAQAAAGASDDAAALEAVRKAEALLERPRQPWLSRVDRHLAAGSWDKTWAAMHKLMLEGLGEAARPAASAPSYLTAAE